MMQMKRKMNRQACVDGIFDSCLCLTTPKIVSHPGGPWVLSTPGVSGNSRSRSFPRMDAFDSLSRTLGMDFFIPFPFPNFGNVFFHSLPVPEFWEWIFFIPFPFPNFGNGIFSFPSHSRNLGMDFFIPFPFPNFGNGLFQFPSRSRTLKSHSRSPLCLMGATFILTFYFSRFSLLSLFHPFLANCQSDLEKLV